MITIKYKPRFLRQCKRFGPRLSDDMRAAVALFAKDPYSPALRTHALKGRLKGFCSFSINYKYRIVFQWESKKVAVLVTAGDHSVYE